ncbi:MAG TPA: fluoride efflux transporter CrcB [Solirubrobacteraceae bacterium]|nr:fluoride efflux transporter CrcB [Solirubrobacteraceae bacterium]
MNGAITYLGVALLGAVGAVARYGVDLAVAARFGSEFPRGTLAVNLTGTLALGVLVGGAVPASVELILGIGFLGSYTTFSTWMVESVRLGEAGEIVLLVVNIGLPMLLGFGIATLGYLVGSAIV